MQRVCFGEVLRARPALDNFHVWIEDGVGFASSWEWFEAHAMFLSLAGVLPDARGQGWHKRFIQARVRHAKRLGYPRVITYTSPENLRSANNLIESGFRLYTPRLAYGMKGAIYLQKRLDT